MYHFELDLTAVVSAASVLIAIIALAYSRKDRRSDQEKKEEEEEKRRHDAEHSELQQGLRDINEKVGKTESAMKSALAGELKGFRITMDEKLSDVYEKQNAIKGNYLDRFATQAELTTRTREELIERFHSHETAILQRLDDLKTMILSNNKDK